MRGCMALRAAQASALPAQRTRADRAATRAVPLPPHHARTAPRRAAAAPASPASPRPAAALPAWASGFAPAARSPAATRSAAATVRAFYAAVNARQLDAAMAYIEDECVYEDMIYSAPFVGKDAVAAHFASVCRILPADASFVIDDITEGDACAVGLTWHVELDGVPFPFGRGASFVRLSRAGRIAFARDIPEPSSKPGGVALYVVAFLAAVLRRLPGALPAAAKAAGALPAPQQQRAPPPPPPPPLPPLPGWVSPALWGVFALYAYALLLGTELPGEPAWNIQPHTLQSVTDLSLDFFFVAPALDAAGLSLFPAPAVHPAELALFNLVNAWSLMFLGLLAADARGARLPLLPVWSGQMFLTNVFLLPWMAARASPGASADADDDAAADAAVSADARLPPPLAALAASPLLGVVGGAVGVASVAWFALADVPGAAAGADASSLAARWAHLLSVAQEDRLTLAFGVDCVVYSAAQAWLIGDERAALLAARPGLALPPAWQRFVPFAGLAAWLATRPRADAQQE